MPLIIDAFWLLVRRSRALAELMDVTGSELAGLKVPAEVQGQSLVPVLKNWPPVCAAGVIPQPRQLRPTCNRLNLPPDQLRRVYDMKADPHQFTNLAKHPQHAKTAALLDTHLNNRLRKAGLQGDRGGRYATSACG